MCATSCRSTSVCYFKSAFDHEGRPVAFDTWHDDLQLYLLSDIKESVSLFDHVSGVAPAPPATADSATRSHWLSHDATACLAIRNHLPVAKYLVTHLRTSDTRYRATAPVEDHFLSLDPTSLTVDLLEQHLLAAETSSFAVGAARGTPRSPFFEGCSPSPLSPSFAFAAASEVSLTEDVGAASTSAKHRSNKGKGGRGGGGGSGGGGGGSGSGGGGSDGGGGGSGGGGGGGIGGGSGGSSGGTGGSRGGGGSGGGGTGGGRSGSQRGGPGGGQRQQQQRPKFHIEHRCFSRLDDAWRAEFGDDVERPRWMDLLRSGVAIFDLDNDANLSAMYAFSFSAEGDYYRTTLTTLPARVPVKLAHPSGGPVVARSSTVLPCPAVPSSSLSGLHLPSFSTNLVRTAALQDAMVTTTTPGGSSLYTLATEPPQVAASAQVSTSGQIAASCSCRLLSHQTLLWHHRLGHPSLPRLRGMHSRFLVSGLPKSVPPLPPSPAPPCLPCVKGRQRAARHSSSSPVTTSPLQILDMDVKGEVVDVLIPWIHTVRLQLCERFGTDLPVLRLHSDRGGEFSSDLLREFCRGEGILQSFMLPDSPQQYGIAERRIGLVMEVARTSMIHTDAPHFLWPFAVWTPRSTSRFPSTVSSPPPPPPFFFAPDPPPVDPLPPQGPAPSGVSQVDPLLGTAPVQVAAASGAALGAVSGGAASGGAEPGGAGSEGAGSGGAEPGGAEPEGVDPRGVELHELEALETLELEVLLFMLEMAVQEVLWLCPGGTHTSGAGAGGRDGVGCARAGDPTEPGGVGAGGPGARGARAAGAGVGSTCARGAGAAGAGAFDPGAGGAGGTVQPRKYFVPLLQHVLCVPSSTGLPPPFPCSPPDQSQPPLEPASPLPAPSPYTEQSGTLTECREPASRPVSPVCTAYRAPRLRPPPVPGTHAMALPPSSVPLRVPLRVPLPAPPESSLPEVPDPASNRARAANPNVSRLLATAVTDPSFESATASALVAELLEFPELLDFAAACHLDYATALVAESVSASPPSVGGECALSMDVLEDRQEDFECLAAAVPRFASMLLAPEGDSDAPDIPTPRSYAEANTGTYVDEVPPPGANIVDGLWISRVKRPPGSPPAFKTCYVARGFSQRQGVDYFQTFSPTLKMTTLRVLLQVAAQCDYELHSLDFSTAFLHGSLHEKIWLRQPPGVTGTFPAGTQWSLRRPVYSLRQAPRECHDTLRTTLAALGFAPSTTDPSLFLRTDISLPPFYVLVYVDNLVFATADTEALTLVKPKL
ncbi:unnamed protein product [Closterium sp. NIES-53]